MASALLGLALARAQAAPFAYITNEGSGTVSVIDTATNTVVDTVFVGGSPFGVAVHPEGTRVYVANSASNTVSVIDTATNKLIATIPLPSGSAPKGVVVHPTGTRLYVVGAFGVTVIDTATNIVVATITASPTTGGVAVNPAGTRLYVSINGTGVMVHDLLTNKTITFISLGGVISSTVPYGVAVNPAGTRLLVANSGANNVAVIDTATNKVIANVNVGGTPRAFGQFIGPECLKPAAPTVTDPGTSVLSGATYTVTWNSVAHATRYLIEESTSSAFASPTSSFVSGTSATFSHAATSATTYYYRVIADNQPCSLNSDFSNVVDMVVQPPADLIVESVTINPTSMAAGGTVDVTFSIRNQGGTAAGVMANEIRLTSTAGTNVLLATRNVSGLAAGASTGPLTERVTIPGATAAGAYSILVVADAGGTVAESNDANNTSGAAIIVPKLLDVPYYSQGNTNWCFIASTAMLLSSLGLTVKPRDVAHALNKDFLGYISNTELFPGSSYKDYISAAGYEAHIQLWTGFGDSLFTYLKQSIANDQPVLLAISAKDHALVIVGTDESGVYVHDPSGAVTDRLGARKIRGHISWEQLRSMPKILDLTIVEFITVRINAKPARIRLPVTVDFDSAVYDREKNEWTAQSSFWFVSSDFTGIYMVNWNGKRTYGYEVVPFKSPPRNSIDGATGTILLPSDMISLAVRVANAGSGDIRVTLDGRVEEVDSTLKVIKTLREYPPTSAFTLRSSQISTDKELFLLSPMAKDGFGSQVDLQALGFLDNNSASVQYVRFTIRALVNGEAVDQFSVVVAANETAAAPQPYLTLTLNQTTFHPGDTLHVGLQARNPGPDFAVDFYFGVLLPDGVTVFFFTGLSPINGVVARLDGDPRTFKPLVTNILIPQGLNITLDDVLVVTFPPDFPPGTYILFTAITVPDTFTDALAGADGILAVEAKSFSFSP